MMRTESGISPAARRRRQVRPVGRACRAGSSVAVHAAFGEASGRRSAYGSHGHRVATGWSHQSHRAANRSGTARGRCGCCPGSSGNSCCYLHHSHPCRREAIRAIRWWGVSAAPPLLGARAAPVCAHPGHPALAAARAAAAATAWTAAAYAHPGRGTRPAHRGLRTVETAETVDWRRSARASLLSDDMMDGCLSRQVSWSERRARPPTCRGSIWKRGGRARGRRGSARLLERAPGNRPVGASRRAARREELRGCREGNSRAEP